MELGLTIMIGNFFFYMSFSQRKSNIIFTDSSKERGGMSIDQIIIIMRWTMNSILDHGRNCEPRRVIINDQTDFLHKYLSENSISIITRFVKTI